MKSALISTEHQDFIDFKSDLEMGRVFYKDVVVEKWRDMKAHERWAFFRGAHMFCNNDQAEEIMVLVKVAGELWLMEIGA